jgi:hypothetical protein
MALATMPPVRMTLWRAAPNCAMVLGLPCHPIRDNQKKVRPPASASVKPSAGVDLLPGTGDARSMICWSDRTWLPPESFTLICTAYPGNNRATLTKSTCYRNPAGLPFRSVKMTVNEVRRKGRWPPTALACSANLPEAG